VGDPSQLGAEMTVIAWDGRTLAADKQMGVDYPRTVCKIRRLANGELIGVTGSFDQGLMLAAWYEAGADPEAFPAFQADQEKNSELLIVRVDGVVCSLSNQPVPMPLENRQHAVGSGRDFAAAAMHLGKTAAEAVEITNLLCASCGCGVDTLELAP
jgi:hypothetical protein